MQPRITGTTMPVLEFKLDPNESIISEAGKGVAANSTHRQACACD